MYVGIKSHVGHVRSNNEDAYFVRPPLLAVADGMGGHDAGEVASAAAVAALAQCTWTETDPGELAERMLHSVRAAQRRIEEASEGNASWRGMGTTLTAAFFGKKHIHIAHIGDSRAYLWREGTLRLLTTDHSVASELVRAGQLNEQDAARHPQRHVLTRAVTAGVAPEVDMIMAERGPDDTLLLCTDGLNAHVTDKEIGAVLASGGAPQAAADELVRLALERGGSDNVTVIVARSTRPEVIR